MENTHVKQEIDSLRVVLQTNPSKKTTKAYLFK